MRHDNFACELFSPENLVRWPMANAILQFSDFETYMRLCNRASVRIALR